MKIKTNELSRDALDRLVARCEGIKLNEGNTLSNDCDVYAPSTDWSQGGPIIEREQIAIWWEKWDDVDSALPVWTAVRFNEGDYYGSTPLIAAMRCYVASKLGDEVEVPDELLQGASE